jgi:Cu/Ag efflux protein CusF
MRKDYNPPTASSHSVKSEWAPDLIKKLENIKVPEIELHSHQRRLKLALLSSRYFKEDPIMFWTKRLVPAGVALAFILVLGFSVIQPKLQIARAMEIAKNDPQIQQLIKDYGVEIKEVKLQHGKAYVLLALPEEKLPPRPALKGGEETALPGPVQFYITYQDPKTGEVIQSSGSIAKIDLKTKKVEKLELVEETKIDIAPLTEEEKARAIEIAKSDPKIKEMLPADSEIVAVKPLPPLKLKIQTTSEENGARVVAYDEREDRRVNVIFESEKGKDIITVNLSTGAIEGAMSTGLIGEIQERPESEYPSPIKPEFYLEPDEVETLPGEGEIKIYEGPKSK